MRARVGGVEPGRAAWLSVAAALLLSVGTASTDPTPSTILALVALLACLVAALGLGHSLLGHMGERSVVTILAVGIAAETVVGIAAPAVLDVRFILAFTAAAAVGLVALFTTGLRQRIALVGVVGIHFCLMMWMFAAVPLRDMDVHLFQQDASQALLGGINPYGITFENIYGLGTPLYADEVQVGGRLTFGFPYPPLTLLLALPGYILGDDVRFAALAAVSLTALLLGFMRSGPMAAGAAVMLLLSPLTARVLHNAWTEPFVVLWLGATVLLAVRTSRLTPVALGLLIGTKQYVPLLLPLAVGLMAEIRRRVGWRAMVGVAIGTAALTALPFFIWGPRDFMFSTVTFHVLQPFREDGSTIAALLHRAGLPMPPTWLGFLVAGVVLVGVLMRAPRTPSGFSLAAATVLIAFFLFSKYAFMNYYFVGMVALLCAVAASEGRALLHRAYGDDHNIRSADP